MNNLRNALVSLTQRDLVRNVFSVGSGATAGQIILIAFSPLITRLFGPDVFGIQGVFLATLGIMGPFIALRYPMAIVVAKDEASARSLELLSMLIAFLVSCLIGLVLLFKQNWVSSVLQIDALGGLIWFLPVALFLTALRDVANFRAVRLRAFALVGSATVVQAFVINASRVLGGLVYPFAGTLVAVTSLASVVETTLLRLGTRKHMPPVPALTWVRAVELLKEHRDFPLFRMPSDVVGAASQSVPVILLAVLFSPVTAGLYVLTRSVMNLPTNIIGVSFGAVVYSRFAELKREGAALTPLYLKATVVLAALAPIIIGMAWFAPPVFAFVFGEEWREAGEYARWFSLWIATRVALVPSVSVLPTIGRQRLSLMFSMTDLTVRVCTVVIVGWVSGSALMVVAWFAVNCVMVNLVALFTYVWCVIRFDRDRKETEIG